jgi:hypothetical protein
MIKIIGAGFGRTGTLSLKAALEELGFTKCYHMQEVYTHPGHVKLWRAASRGRSVDWDTLFHGYQATVDWPACAFYQELLRHYPEAKVLLSTRDPEQWYTSAAQTIYRTARTFPVTWVRHCVPGIGPFIRMVDEVIWKGTFQGRFGDKPYAVGVFTHHNEEVKRMVPPERLLVYEVTEGWEPLCRFLQVPVPSGKPFPHLNDRMTFQKVGKQHARRAQLLFSAVLVLVPLIIRWLAPRTRWSRC